MISRAQSYPVTDEFIIHETGAEYLPFSSLLREYNLHLLQIPPLFHYLQGILQTFKPRKAGLAEPSTCSPAPSLSPYLSPTRARDTFGTTFTGQQ